MALEVFGAHGEGAFLVARADNQEFDLRMGGVNQLRRFQQGAECLFAGSRV